MSQTELSISDLNPNKSELWLTLLHTKFYQIRYQYKLIILIIYSGVARMSKLHGHSVGTFSACVTCIC